ncbi:hypothetical protein HMPREF9088_1327 [Enterococcus italicus DSM 15952]|uniref:Uncharacterized protein n=1 Tax=Enterococcus italicus (strain DSM 15952 / CCUG 50447 / LMG 22039 / TP 1.5) TaxID=888064 RepID=E6LG37_ENTI1|nr:hypothetical protein HMPREF9088_1327 [Enterococcus italicus DSM 15952]
MLILAKILSNKRQTFFIFSNNGYNKEDYVKRRLCEKNFE